MSRDGMHQPPRFAERAVSWAAGPDAADHVVGDLREEYAARVATAGEQSARAWYRRQVARSVLPLLGARWVSRRTNAAAAQPPRHMDSLKSDLSYAWRTLARRRGFTVVAVLTLALGIGTATAIFTVVDGVLLRPLPFSGGEQLVTIWQTDTLWRQQATLRDRWDRLWFTYPEFQQWSSEQRSFASLAAFGDQEMAMTGAGEAAQVSVATATPGLMTVLRARVAIGRWFLPNEVGTGTERLAVLSHELWESRFGADTAMIGRSVTLDDHAYRVIGVLPAGFELRSVTTGRRALASIWIPLGSDGGGAAWDSSYEVIGRLKPGVPLDAAGVEIDRLHRAVAGKPEKGARVVPRLEAETGAARRPLALLSVGVALLLAMACVNVAMLLLGEAPARELELATRRALGASTLRVVRQLLTESVVLAAMGGIAGLAIAFVGVRLLIAAAPPGLPRIGDVAVSVRTLVFCMTAVLGTALTFGLVPALSVSKAQATESLRARTGQLGRRQKRLHGAAIGLQVAMALLLLVSAIVVTRSLRNLTAVDTGIAADHVLTITITAPAARYATRPAVLQYYDALETRLAALPGVRHVGATANLPFSERNQTTSVEVEGGGRPGDEKPNVQRRVVRPGFFAAMGIPLRAGRLFDGSESATGEAMIVDETMANRLWPGEAALGKRVKAFDAWFTVTGVVGAVYHERLDQPPRPTFYIPHVRQVTRQMTLVVTADRDPLALTEEVRRALWEIDVSVPIASLATMSSRVARSLANERYRTGLLDVFGAAAALLTGVGVFGLAARAVSQRRREIGIRIALGAEAGSVARVVAREQTVAVGIGLAVGLVAAVLVAPLLGDFAFGASATDPTTILVATIALIGTSVAAVIPAVRTATRIDPGEVIREG